MPSFVFNRDTTNEEAYNKLVSGPVKIGNSTLTLAPTTYLSGLGSAIGAANSVVVGAASDIKKAAVSLFTEPNSSGQPIRTAAALLSQSALGGVVNRFTTSSAGQSISSAISDGISGVGNTIGTAVSETAEAIGNTVNVAATNVKGFIAPVTETLDTIKGIGEEFDKIIEETFLGQVFKIKGSEILCALFCIIISFLSCKTRQGLYDAVLSIKQGIATANSAISSINNMTATMVEVPLFNDKTIVDNITSLFGKNLQGKALTNVINAPPGTQTKKPVFSLDAPQDVQKIIRDIVSLLSILSKGQISVPVGLSDTSTIWGFAQAVLSIVQMVLIQAVDQFLTRVVKDIEASLKKMIPQMCVGNLAVKFINRIMDAIRNIKEFLLEQLKGLLGDGTGFGLKFKTFGWYFKEMQELFAILEALGIILKKFPDLILQCGISPCNDLSSKDMQDLQEAIQNGLRVDETNAPATFKINSRIPEGKTLDELADTFKTMTGNPDSYVVKNPTGFHVIMPDMFKDAPSQILNIINSPDFMNTLGGAYTLYVDPNSGINVVYTYELKC